MLEFLLVVLFTVFCVWQSIRIVALVRSGEKVGFHTQFMAVAFPFVSLGLAVAIIDHVLALF